jgi:hypothetical protein
MVELAMPRLPVTAQDCYQEPEKLGPLATGHQSLLAVDLRSALVAEFRDALERAQRATHLIDEATASVHEFRKALRRARALLRLMRSALRRGDYLDLRNSVRDARRVLSTARDHAVAPVRLGTLSPPGDLPEVALRVITRAELAAPTVEDVAALLRDAGKRIAGAGDALTAALAATIRWDVIDQGLAQTFRAGRKAFVRARRSLPELHRWRRRNKELTQQLDLISSRAGARTRAVFARHSALDEILSEVVDLTMTREFVLTHSFSEPPEQVAELLRLIDRRIKARAKAARRGAGELLGARPSQFARRVRKACGDDATGAGKRRREASITRRSARSRAK